MDSEGAVTSKSKLQSKVKALSGVDILTETGEYKSTYEILYDIAKVWKSINDMDQAALLELISGKRNSSVIAALLQNPEDLKAAYEDAMDAEGSALKENERYLNSIQGRVDQFNNAMQAMWSNTLDSDVVKWFVNLGTELIKIVDTIGLIPSILASILAYKIAVGAVKMFDLTSLGTYISLLFTANSATEVQGLLINKNALAQKLLNSTLIQAQAARMGLTAADLAGYSVTQLLTLGVKGLAAGFKNLWIAMGPVGWAIIGITIALTAGIGIFNAVHKTTEELTEELNELKYELQDIQSELDSVNSELEITSNRMAELLAKDSLTFTEKEELENLRKQNDELQRRIDLLDSERKLKQSEAAKDFTTLMDKSINEDTYDTGGKRGFWDRLADAFDTEHKSTIWSGDEYFDYLIEEYEKELQKQQDQEGREINRWTETKANPEKYSEKIGEQLKAWTDAADGLDYGINNETDEWLDYVYNLQDKWAIASGGNNAKTNAITRIFNKDENAEISDSIDEYVESLRNGDTNAKSSIENIIKNNKALVEDLEASGLSADEAIDYFTSFASELEFATLEGKIKEVSKAATNFEKLLKGGLFKVDGVDTGLADLFDEEGKIIQKKLSQVFKDTSDQTREEITKLLESSYDMIANGLDSSEIGYLMNRMGLSFSRAILEIEKNNLTNKNLELFPGLEDEISGIIDTFSELTSAVGSVVDAMDTLDKARAEEAYSGSVSLETLEALMQSTDNYADLIEVDETGAIRLATNAQEILVAQKIEAIKQNAALALEEAELAYQEALHTEQTYSQTGPAQDFMRGLWNEVGGAMAFVTSLWRDLNSGNWDGAWDRAQAARESSITQKETDYANQAAAASVAVAEASKKVENAQKMNDVAQGLTPDNIKARYSSDEASGGADTEEDANLKKVEDAWEKLLAKYENQLALITNERDLIQAEIDRIEAQGGKASAQYYEDLKRNSEEEKNLLIQKKTALEQYLEANKNVIDQDTWTDYNNEINETAVAIKECEQNSLEWAEALREIDLHYFEQATDEISRIGDELDLVNRLLEDEDVADENGNWSSAALTRMGMYTNQMELAASEAARYKEEIDKLNEQYKKGELSEEQYQESLSDLVSGQHDAIQSYEDAKDSVVDMNEARIDAIKEGIEKEIEAYEDLIDAKKEELDAERDLYDFRKNIKNQTKDISELERRIASLSGSSASSDIAERRKLEAQLLKAKEGLNDTYYDHSRDAQSQALDEESAAYSLSKERYIEQLEEQLKDTETLIQNSIMDVLLNADMVYTELNNLADLYGIYLSDSLTQPWKDASAQAVAWKNELAGTLSDSELMLITHENGVVTAFSNGVATKLQGTWNKAQTAAKNYAGYLTDTELRNQFTNTLTGFGNQIQNIINKWNGVKAAADAAYAAQTRKVTVGGNVTSTGGSGSIGSGSGSGGGVGGGYVEFKPVHSGPDVTNLQKILNKFFSLRDGDITGQYDNATYMAVREMQKKLGITASGKFDAKTKAALEKYLNAQPVGSWFRSTGTYIPGAMYANGTTGTTHDQWAITDEPQFGDELVLVPGKDGNLSFVRKGTGIIPADMTQKLWELAQIPTSDLMNKNLTAIVPNITKNDFKNEFNFDSLVHVDHCDQGTLKELEKMVDNKINDFNKSLNYSLKKFAR